MSFYDKGDLPVKIGDTISWVSIIGKRSAKVIRQEKRGTGEVLIVVMDGQELAFTPHEIKAMRVVF